MSTPFFIALSPTLLWFVLTFGHLYVPYILPVNGICDFRRSRPSGCTAFHWNLAWLNLDLPTSEAPISKINLTPLDISPDPSSHFRRHAVEPSDTPLAMSSI
ncbi:hypothetical protein BS47DRAFT_1351609 [Hydnum rufescens UP504]|uniref:Uncharacterized protein n=1 Tax=Hydnum rufescens UP504 TaxID=1448309 RepID=A0A9P6AKV1_9AGAM|nr:hypothetical protein BS47DRAFT_1351609 [Hydnum rufescens UP504]